MSDDRKSPQAAGSVAANSAYDSAAQIGVFLFSLGAGILLSRFLGAEGRGQYVLATSIAAGMLQELGNLGMTLGAQVFAARLRERAGEVHALVLLLSIAVGAAAALLLFLLREWLLAHPFRGLNPAHLTLLAAAAPTLIYVPVWHGFMVGLGLVRQRALADFLFGIVQSGAVVALCFAYHRREPELLHGVVVSYFAIHAVAAALMLLRLRRERVLWATPRAGLLREFLSYSRWVYAGNAAVSVLSRFDQFIVNAWFSISSLGVYNLATSLSARSAILAEALNRSLYARVCSAPRDEAAALCARAFRQMLVIGFGGLAVGAVCGLLIPFVYGSDFRAAVWMFPIVLSGWVCMNAARMPAMFLSGHLADPRITMRINWTIVPIQAALIVVGAERYGLAGLASALSISYLLLMVFTVRAFLHRAPWIHPREMFPRGDDLSAWATLLARFRRG